MVNPTENTTGLEASLRALCLLLLPAVAAFDLCSTCCCAFCSDVVVVAVSVVVVFDRRCPILPLLATESAGRRAIHVCC